MKPSVLFALGALALCAAESARAAEFWVGSGAGCHFETIREAIAAARSTSEADTIRIAKNNRYTHQALLLDTSASLVGGYLSCSPTERKGYVELLGNDLQAVFVISSHDPDGIDVHLEGLDISRGGADVAFEQHGGMVVAGHARVHLYDSAVRFSFAFAGHGGGITVQGSHAALTLERQVVIGENATYGSGGGILVDGGRLAIRPHGVTIQQNIALDGRGGGIAVLNGGTLSESTDPLGRPLPVDTVRIVQNYGSRGGGGVYVGGADSKLLAGEITVAENTSDDGHGGGILIENRGHAELLGFAEHPHQPCAPEQECLRVSHNTSMSSGAALALRNGGTANVEGAFVHSNATLGSRARGNAFLIDGPGSRLTLANSVITDNACDRRVGECAVVDIVAGKAPEPVAAFDYTTFARNGNEDGALIYVASLGRQEGFDARGFGNLFADKAQLYAFRKGSTPGGANVAFDCSLKNRGADEDGIGVEPISFKAPDNGDYRLAPGNAAVDYCDGSERTPLDLDRRPRGIDDPDHANRGGHADNRYDLGAYEFRAVADLLFSNGFEATP